MYRTARRTGGAGGAEKKPGGREKGEGSEDEDSREEDSEDEEEDEDSWEQVGGNRDFVCVVASSLVCFSACG